MSLGALSAFMAAVVTGALLGTDAASLHHLQLRRPNNLASFASFSSAEGFWPSFGAPVFALAAAVHGVAVLVARER